MTSGNDSILLRLSALINRGFVKVEEGRVPVYLHPESPFWFVPNEPADRILDRLLAGVGPGELLNGWAAVSSAPFETIQHDLNALARAITPPSHAPYKGRADHPLTGLSEFWIHITNACNLACRHCLFGCKPGKADSLERSQVEAAVSEAYQLGCRLFCFTGGEPFVYTGFPDLLRALLHYEDLKIAVLTNGNLLEHQVQKLADLDRSRLHLQVSLDGPEPVHDRIRGAGDFKKVVQGLDGLRKAGLACSTVMSVNADSSDFMPDFIRTSAELGLGTVHFMWHFPLGSGSDLARPALDTFFNRFQDAVAEAERLGVVIDNLEALRAQIFTHRGTRFDLGNGGWESLALGPDGSIYPTPALVGNRSMIGGHLSDGLERVRRNSPLLKKIRALSLLDHPETAEDPWRFLLGGGDLDHLLTNRNADGQGCDPYLPFYRRMAARLIADEALELPVPSTPGLVLRMGDLTTDCPSGAEVNFTHSNCLLSLGDGGARALVRSYYSAVAEEVDETIVNPVQYDAEEVAFIPEEGRIRMYGCGSPISDTDLESGEVLVDLGSGSGVECFLASRTVGPDGRVVGVDMTDAMLAIARKSQHAVAAYLGYDNASFLKGYLEDLPLAGDLADVVISNCVINLCRNKRKVFSEIFRILKPGGRLVISDVVCETEPSLAIRADHKLTGECIGGAMVQDYLFSVLKDLGFVGPRLIRRFPYRVVEDHPFFSLTFSAYKPTEINTIRLLYGGPFKAIVLDDGRVLERGLAARAALDSEIEYTFLEDTGVYLLDERSGALANADAVDCGCCVMAMPPERSEADCACSGSPAKEAEKVESCCSGPPATEPEKVESCCCSPEEDLKANASTGMLESGSAAHETGCLVCGALLQYTEIPQEKTCAQCGRVAMADAACTQGHFVCDLCHVGDPIEVIKAVCRDSKETDMGRLFEQIRSLPCFSMHGPQHHALVPAVILTTFRNLGGTVHDLQIMAAIERGGLAPGGACGFMGLCGAASGAGVAFAMLLGSNPLRAESRKIAMKVTATVLEKITEQEAARCCRRESFLALETAAVLSRNYLPIPLQMKTGAVCDQYDLNKECLGIDCPLFPK